MKKFLTLLLLVPGLMLAQQTKLIKGKITDGKLPMGDVQITVDGTDNTAFTNAEGRYEITAAEGDLLVYSYTGMREMRVRVEDVTRFLNLVMLPDITELDEVVVTKSRRKSQEDLSNEYVSNKRIIRTAFGYLDADRAPGLVRTLDGDDINNINLCILDLARARWGGVQVVGNCTTGGAILLSRGARSLYSGTQDFTNIGGVIYDVDGQIFTDAPIWLNIAQIKRLAIFQNLAMTNRYGTIGAGGVMVINTINGVDARQPKDLARLRNNYLKEDPLSAQGVMENAPAYLQKLNATTSLAAAKEVYKEYAMQYAASPYFFLESYRHFAARDRSFAREIIAANQQKFAGNSVLLKALAYMYDAEGDTKEALKLYKEIFILRPHYSQSYQDLAQAYRNAGEPGKAASIYARYKYLLDEGFLVGSDEFGKIIQHESDNLLQLEASRLGTRSSDIAADPFVQETTRLTFEWNDSEAEFDLQFVNPEKQYAFWNHSFEKSETRIADEKAAGYNMEEKIIDGKLPGQWMVNAIYHGNKSLTPTYMKVTVYSNYGTPQQSKQVRVFPLHVKGTNTQLLRLNVASKLVMN